eukprot:6203682-Pleurochrysis_carterae.AAC.5
MRVLAGARVCSKVGVSKREMHKSISAKHHAQDGETACSKACECARLSRGPFVLAVMHLASYSCPRDKNVLTHAGGRDRNGEGCQEWRGISARFHVAKNG